MRHLLGQVLLHIEGVVQDSKHDSMQSMDGSHHRFSLPCALSIFFNLRWAGCLKALERLLYVAVKSLLVDFSITKIRPNQDLGAGITMGEKS